MAISKLAQIGAAVASVTTIAGGIAIAIPLMRSDPPPWASRDTVAGSADMLKDAIQDTAREIRVDLLAGRLFNYRAAQCAAIRSRNMPLAASIGQQIQGARDQYLALSKVPFDIRDCAEF